MLHFRQNISDLHPSFETHCGTPVSVPFYKSITHLSLFIQQQCNSRTFDCQLKYAYLYWAMENISLFFNNFLSLIFLGRLGVGIWARGLILLKSSSLILFKYSMKCKDITSHVKFNGRMPEILRSLKFPNHSLIEKVW